MLEEEYEHYTSHGISFNKRYT